MKKKPVNISASVLDRLKNIARKQNFDFNFLLLRYIQERFLSRLAHSRHVNRFVKSWLIPKRQLTFNTRMKDFYDISFLAYEFDFEGKALPSASY